MVRIPLLAGALLLALAGPARAQVAPGIPSTGAPATAGPDSAAATLDGQLAGEAALYRLLEVLRDDAARAALVAALEASGAASEAGAADAATLGAVGGAGDENLAQRLAALTLGLAADLRAQTARLWAQIATLPALAARLPAIGASERQVVAALLATVLSTVAASLATRAGASALARRLRPPPGTGAARRVGRALLALLAHAGGVLLAWAVGAALAVLLFSEGWTPWTSQVLYLNAFLAFGLARVALRAVANPRAEAEPALLSVDHRAQRAIYRSLRPVAGCLAQGFLFAVPLLELWAGFAAARPARLLVATAAALLAFWAIRRIRRALGAARPEPLAPAQAPPPQPMASADPLPGTIGPPPPLPLPGAVVPGDPVGAPSTAPAAMAAGLGSAWASLWPLLAVLYVLYAWVTAVTRPALATGIVLGGTAATGLAVLMVVAALQLLRRAGRLSWPLPGLAHAALPTLKPRADRIAASLGAALAVALLLAAPLAAALGWGWVEAGLLLERPLPRRLAGQAASAALVVLGAAVLWALVASWIDARLARSEGVAGGDSGRARTLLALFRNAFTVAVAVIAGMVALSQLGLDIAPLLAGAGVVGLAVGFGAQTLVKDIITGVFIQLEGAIDVGDVVAVAGITGGVERLTIRSVRLRTMDGATHVIPFSAVTTVTNLTRDYGYHVADLLVGYGQSVPAVRAGMEEAFARLLRDPLAADVDGALDMQGVAELRGDAVLVRARIRTRAGRQWDVGRRYSELLKEVLDERGIEVPVPTRTILVAPPARPAAPGPEDPGSPGAPA